VRADRVVLPSCASPRAATERRDEVVAMPIRFTMPGFRPRITAESRESAELVVAALAAIETYRQRAKDDAAKRSDKANELYWYHDNDQGALWNYTTALRKFLIQVQPACKNAKWGVQCKKDLIEWAKEYGTIFEGWAADVYPASSAVGAGASADDGTHALREGDEVVAKFPGFRGRESNPYFAATVKNINAGKCSLTYEDGDFGDDVRADEIFYAPGRPANWGKGDLRGNDMLPDGAQPVEIEGAGAPVDVEEVGKRLQLVDRALAHVDKFRSCDGDYIHWTGYFLFS